MSDVAPEPNNNKVTPPESAPRAPMRWWESLHVKFSWAQIILLIFVVGGTIVVLSTVQRSLMIEKGYKLAKEIGLRMVAQFEERIRLAEALTTSMAKLGASLTKDRLLFKKIIPSILDYPGESQFIAGGGIWPEPYAFTPGVVRRSFFWGRNKAGKLIYYDDYNKPSGAGYHNEEWYLPVILSSTKKQYWSKSYMDPYSYQPMVTCSMPIIAAGKKIGVATVDIKLEGLDDLFKKSAKAVGGYIFAVDRNNKFLSFPNHKMAKKYTMDKKGNTVEEFLHVIELAKKEKCCWAMANYLKTINKKRIAQAGLNSQITKKLTKSLRKRNKQITQQEALLIAALTQGVNIKKTISHKRLFIKSDPILKEPVIASIFVIPETHWKIIVITPKSKFYNAAQAATEEIVLYVVIFELIALFITFLVLRRLFINPIKKMAKTIRKKNSIDNLYGEKLHDRYRDELGTLAYEFNQRTRELIEAIERTNIANKELSQLRNYLSNIIDSMPSILIGVDTSNHITQWNKRAEQETGVPAKEAQGKDLSDIFPQLISEMNKIGESIRTKQPIEEQKKARQSEEGVFYEDITIYPLIANGAKGAVVRIDDVTDKVRMEEMMIQSEKMLSVGGLAAGMAHEINNPLAGMIQTANVMQRRLLEKIDLPANIKAAEEAGTTTAAIQKFMGARGIAKMIEDIKESGERVSTIIQNMLSFARKSDKQHSSHDLAEIIDKTLELASADYNLKKHYDFKKIVISKKYTKDIPLISCEKSQIQ